MKLKNKKKIEKFNISKMRKKPNFKSDRPVYNHLNVNFIKTTLKTFFLLKSRLDFLHF